MHCLVRIQRKARLVTAEPLEKAQESCQRRGVWKDEQHVYIQNPGQGRVDFRRWEMTTLMSFIFFVLMPLKIRRGGGNHCKLLSSLLWSSSICCKHDTVFVLFLFCCYLFLAPIKATQKCVGGGFRLQQLFVQEENTPCYAFYTLSKEGCAPRRFAEQVLCVLLFWEIPPIIIGNLYMELIC